MDNELQEKLKSSVGQVKRAETPAPRFLVGQASVPAKKEIPKQLNHLKLQELLNCEFRNLYRRVTVPFGSASCILPAASCLYSGHNRILSINLAWPTKTAMAITALGVTSSISVMVSSSTTCTY